MSVSILNIFENRTQRVVFCGYIFIWVLHGQLVTWSKNGTEGLDYSPSVVVLIAELLKCAVALGLYAKDNSITSLPDLLFKERKLFFLYSIPSGLYAIYNIVGFYSLSLTDPPTYFILLQLRSLVIGVVYQMLFSKMLSRSQWASLAILTLGTSTKQISTESGFHIELNSAIALIVLQIFCSCFASVYNEYLLKHRTVDFWAQNLFFYINSIIINSLVFVASNNQTNSTAALLRPPVVLIACNLAVIGITTVMFLKHLNSVLKNFASALELFFTTVASYTFFNISINLQTVCSIVLIWLSLYVYAIEPISQTTKEDEAEEEKNPYDDEEP